MQRQNLSIGVLPGLNESVDQEVGGAGESVVLFFYRKDVEHKGREQITRSQKTEDEQPVAALGDSRVCFQSNGTCVINGLWKLFAKGGFVASEQGKRPFGRVAT